MRLTRRLAAANLLALVIAGCQIAAPSAAPTAAPAANTGAAAAPTTAAAAAAAAAGTGTCTTPKDVHIAVVTHGQATSNFWAVVQNGVKQAQQDLCINVEYTSPETFDMVRMGELIDAAVAKKPDGLVVSIPDADALGPHIKKAVDAGIPVVSMNSGSDVFQKFGVLTHVGSDEAVAGLAGGRRLGSLGVKNAICVNDEVGNTALDTRCEGFTKGLEETGAKMKVLAAPTGDPIGTQNAVAAALQADSTIDGVVTMGPDGAVPTLKAIKAANRLPQVKMATFDLGPDTLTAVQAGEIQFAIDQQQYLQGYLPVLLLMLYKQYLLMPGGGQAILSGPNFVTKDTAATVLSLSQNGIR
jgi:simple sugar transport system substrate-binding protein